MTRKPVVAGTFYSDDPERLNQEIEECFLDKERGPGELPNGRKDKKMIGVIAPHAGYSFSGKGQAVCYKEVGECEMPDTYIILGTAHSGFEKAAVVIDDFETPFGIVKVDERFTKELIDKNLVEDNKMAHQQEHSIEAQLPFLQFVNKESMNKIRIVPIVVGKDTNYERLGGNIVEIAKEMNKKIMIICSSDFTHHGISYGHVPFRSNVGEKVKEFDLSVIKWIKEIDPWSFMNYVEETSATICGAKAIATFLYACKELGAKEARLEQYYTSGDVTGDYDHCVGYASIIVE